MWTDVSEELISSIFRAENQSKKLPCNMWLCKMSPHRSLGLLIIYPEDGVDAFL
jgi:hypothetical protein